jgi:hypothetical protein
LYENQKALSQQGVYLSSKLGRPNNRLLPSYFQHRLDDWARCNKITSIEEKEQFFEGFLEDFSREIKEASSSHDLFVITSEHLHSRVTRVEDVRAVADFLNRRFEDVKVVCYFRHQLDMSVSRYSTTLKGSSSSRLEDYLKTVSPDNYYYNFLAIADNWSEAFGREKCVFRLYDGELFGGDIRKDFLRQVAPYLDVERLDFELRSSNESLSCLESVAYRSINKHIPRWGTVNGGVSRLNEQMKRAVSQAARLKRGKIEASSENKISELFELSNRKFLDKYFGPSVELMSGKKNQLAGLTCLALDEVKGIVADVCDALLGCVSGGVNIADGDAGKLRDLAIKIELREALSISDSLFLMELARRARPNDLFIAQKVDAYKAGVIMRKRRWWRPRIGKSWFSAGIQKY